MIIYSESFHVEYEIEQEWIQWSKEILIPEMSNTGKFIKAIFFKVTSHPDDTGNTYSIQYYTKNREELEDFYQNYSKEISKLIFEKFGNKVLSFKTELDLMGSFNF